MILKFDKMSGAGNDFVVFDNRRLKYRLTRKQIAHLCHRQFGVGADGLLAVEPAKGKDADFHMRYYNSDGGEAEMCGNGARCFARFVQKRCGWKKTSVRFETKPGVIQAQYIGSEIKLRMTPPQALALNQKITLGGQKFTIHSINTGVPHAVLFVKDAEKVDVFGLGREARFHQLFQPKGANVNFIQVLKPGYLRIRTYERGVEAETLACGTGIVASALISHLVHGFKSPVRLRVQGGDTLSVGFVGEGEQFEEVTLQGPAEITFSGEINV